MRFDRSLGETRARDMDWQRTQYDRHYGLLRRNVSLPMQPTACLDPHYHPAMSQGLCQAALPTVLAKLGLEIRTGNGLNMTDVVGCFDTTIASRCN